MINQQYVLCHECVNMVVTCPPIAPPKSYFLSIIVKSRTTRIYHPFCLHLSFANMRASPFPEIGYSVGQLFKSTQLPLIYKNSKQNSCSAVEYFWRRSSRPRWPRLLPQNSWFGYFVFYCSNKRNCRFPRIQTSSRNNKQHSSRRSFWNWCRRNDALNLDFLKSSKK